VNSRESKKWRRRFRKQIDAASNMTLKKEIFHLARNRDILGIIAIAEGVALAIIAYLVIR
jgi:hypothetical protein